MPYATFLKNHKPTMDNGQWTHLMSEIQVFNMFKLLKVADCFADLQQGYLLARPQPAVDDLIPRPLEASLHIMALDQNARTC